MYNLSTTGTTNWTQNLSLQTGLRTPLSTRQLVTHRGLHTRTFSSKKTDPSFDLPRCSYEIACVSNGKEILPKTFPTDGHCLTGERTDLRKARGGRLRRIVQPGKQTPRFPRPTHLRNLFPRPTLSLVWHARGTAPPSQAI